MMKNLEVGILSTGLANENCSTDNLNYALVFLSTLKKMQSANMSKYANIFFLFYIQIL